MRVPGCLAVVKRKGMHEKNVGMFWVAGRSFYTHTIDYKQPTIMPSSNLYMQYDGCSWENQSPLQALSRRRCVRWARRCMHWRSAMLGC